MARPAAGDLLVGRVLLLASGVARRGRDDAVELVKRGLHAPETPARESGDLELLAFPADPAPHRAAGDDSQRRDEQGGEPDRSPSHGAHLCR